MDMKTCDYCKQYFDFDGYKVGSSTFCSKSCAQKTQFCRNCFVKTTDIPNQGWQKYFWDWAVNKKEGFNFGPAFGESCENTCPRCGSAIHRLWMYFFVPIIPLGKYRILHIMKEGQLNWTVLVRKIKI